MNNPPEMRTNNSLQKSTKWIATLAATVLGLAYVVEQVSGPVILWVLVFCALVGALRPCGKYS